MTALEIRPDEIGRFDLARYREIKARLASAGQAKPVRANVSRMTDPVQPAPHDPALDAYLTKDRAFDLGTLSFAHSTPTPGRIAMRDVIRIVGEVYGVPVMCLRSSRRSAGIVRPRQEGMWLCRKFTLRSLPDIGRAFGGRDHTTVLHAIRKIDALIAESDYVPKAQIFVELYIAQMHSAPSAPSLAAE